MKKTSRSLSLFDIRLEGNDHDVIVVKGSVDEAPSVLLSGFVVLSVNEPIYAKKISLSLYGVIKLNVTTMVQGPRGPAPRNIRYDKRFYELQLDDIDLQPHLVDGSTVKKPLSRNSSSSSLGGLASLSMSTTSLKNFASSASHAQVLAAGNYVFPFSAILPGSLTESIEGLPNATVFYKLQATLERGKFASDVTKKKHIRVVRTLTPDALELFETVAVDNTWPQKVDYSISVPSKAIAIGSSTPISLMIVPLLKGLKLGPIKISLVEYSSYSAPFSNPNGADRTILKVKIRDPLNHMSESNEDSGTEHDFDFQDKWEVTTSVRVPANLSKCTQDCIVLTNIKVRHKLKFVIALVNPDGHISELRASLPVQLFISPFVTVAVKHAENIDISSNNSGNNTDNDAPEDDLMFANSNSEVNLDAVNVSLDNNTSTGPNTSLFAPPNYGNHVYDRLWNSITVEETPIHSGTHSPVESNQPPLLARTSDVSELHQSLQRLRLERETEDADDSGANFDNNVPSRSPLATPLSLQDVPSQLRVSDYFLLPQPNRNSHSLLNVPAHLRSPAQMDSPGFDYLSRTNSFEFKAGSPSKNDWELSSLSRVPSYDNAVKTTSTMGDLPPAYLSDEVERDEGSAAFCVGSLERPRELHTRGGTDMPLYARSKISPSMLLNQNNQSASSLSHMYSDYHERGLDESQSVKSNSRPIISKSPSTSALKNSASKHFGFSMTPLSHIARSATPPPKNSVLVNTSNATQASKTLSLSTRSHNGSQKGGSFASLTGIAFKKDLNNEH
ncbi:unnamed protein product [Kluyveromyces dobzhanskii CBS 2104]|uniref:WGS project CCBQ000000000 data, contig 00099 n=1 Tax=Kluyveromyces dobzhanskii CBS 2104 TaxID=1427455 RepID=A0A0A8L497_9SACH|nr:unnamed protein product [Kluyveromyces dobzhanskii CBS 2104]